MAPKSRTEYSVINMFTGMIGYLLNTIIGFVCRIVFVRTLSAEYLGVSGLFTNILSVLSLAELGISSAIVYALYKPIAENDEDKITAIMQFYKKAYEIIGIVVALAGLITMPFLHLIIRNPPAIHENLYVLYLLYLLNTVSSYFFSYRASLLTAMQRQYIVSGYNYVITIAQSALQTIFLLLTHQYITYLLIQIIGGFVYNIWVSHKAAKDYPYILRKNVQPLSKVEKRSIFINIKALAINKISGVLVNSTDNIAITYFTGLSSVGYASNYSLLSSMVGSLIGLVFNALPGSVGNLNATASKEKSYQFFNALNLMDFWLFGWGGIGIAVVSTDLVKWFYGEQYALPFYIPLILAVNLYTIGMLQACYTYKSTLGLFRYGQYLLFFTGIINLVLDIVMGKIWGMLGIYLATLIARACTNLWYEPYAVYKYGLNKNPLIFWKRYCWYAFILLIAGSLSYFVCSFYHFHIAVNAILKFITCCIIPNIVFILFLHKTQEFTYLKEKFSSVINGIFRRMSK